MKIRLDDIEKKAPYTVPSDYFESLTPRIQSKIEKRTSTRSAVKWVFKWAIAPTFVMVIALAFWVNPFANGNSENTQYLLADISDNDILDYLAQSELNEIELLSLSSSPDIFLEESPNYLNGIDLDDQKVEELLEELDLNATYF